MITDILDIHTGESSQENEEINIVEAIVNHASANAVSKLNNKVLEYLPLNPRKERRNVIVFEPKNEFSNKIFIGY